MGDWRELLEGERARDVELLDRALGLRLTDQAYVEALLDPRGHLFQRLEYVGDSILDVVVVQALVRLEPWTEASLGLVNVEQQALVSDSALGRVAARRGLPDVRTFAASRHRLADRIEAAIGAAWADTGIDAAEAVAVRLVVGPGLHGVAPRAGVPEASPDEAYEAASRVCGHDPVERAWFGAAAAGGPARRRLAVLGNAVLEAALTTAQYVDEPGAAEAQLSEERRTATSNAVIAARSSELGLVIPRDLDDRRGLADEAQALVGAALLDGGILAGLQVACGVPGRRCAPGSVPSP
jgi:dsRNA-specific ribonuclease